MRRELNLAQDFSRGNDLMVYHFTEASTLHQTKSDILRAFIEGFTCFRFEFEARDKRGNKRKFEERVALPHAAGFDERDALDMAEENFAKFLNTVSILLK